MIACVDVAYQDTRAVAAGIAFRDWLDESVVAEQAVSLIQPYESGQFFIRELPCLLAVLRLLPSVQVVLIVGLDGWTKTGLVWGSRHQCSQNALLRGGGRARNSTRQEQATSYISAVGLSAHKQPSTFMQCMDPTGVHSTGSRCSDSSDQRP